MNPNLSTVQAIRFWKRFIDDVVGIWRGTKRAFDIFVKQLNSETKKYGIEFPVDEIQFGRSVHILDLCAWLKENNNIQYKGYSKPTDAKRYLNPNSFHPKSVFNAIPFSQMLRTIRNNSKSETTATELDLVINHFMNSGYRKEVLEELKLKAQNRSNDNTNNQDSNAIVFPIHFFDGVQELKKVVRSLENEFQQLIGDVRIMFAMKKRGSIGSSVVLNKHLSIHNNPSTNQRCNGSGCRQCPLTIDEHSVTINNTEITIPKSLNCKSKNVIYLWLCKLCSEKEAYFGRTTQECHDRSSGHRGCFTDEKWEKSALSMHARDMHQNQFSLNNFSVAVVKKVSPQQLRREEFRFIDKYKTLSLGLNRYKV